MKNKRKTGRIAYVIVLLLSLFAFVGCGSTDTQTDSKTIYYYPKESQMVERDEQDEEQELYLIMSIDTASEAIRLYRYEKQMAYQYYYTLDTDFLDRYGNYYSAANFTPGKIVYIDGVDSEGRIGQIQIADSVWEYSEVEKFSVDEERGIFYIADTKYNYDDELYVFSDKSLSKLSELTDNDTLTVIGRDKKILSIMVTTGHGKLQLLNTGLFEGSYLQLDTSVFAMITTNMLMELPEGDYTLSVANDGWGGVTEIRINRGEITELDLDTIKGEGPQYGNITFVVDVEDAQVRVDGEKVNTGLPVRLRYGWHTLAVVATGYDDWSKRLYVNSEEATISIELEDEAQTQTTVEATDSTDNTDSEDDEETEATEENLSADDVLEEYLSTLTQMLGSL